MSVPGLNNDRYESRLNNTTDPGFATAALITPIFRHLNTGDEAVWGANITSRDFGDNSNVL